MQPIKDKILKALVYYRKPHLAELLKNSIYELDISNTYGSRSFSLISSVKLYTNIASYEKLKNITSEDNNAILNAFHVLYPVKDNSPEIKYIEFFINPDEEIPIVKTIKTNQLDKIDVIYIQNQLSKCDQKLIAGDFDGAITNSRTLVESIIKYILDKKNVEYTARDDIYTLYKRLIVIFKMTPEEYDNKSFKKILSGFFSIIQGITEIRNEFSDSHGESTDKRLNLKERHAKLVINSSKTVGEYLYQLFIDKKE